MKKLLVAYDVRKDSTSSDFLVPVLVENGPALWGLKSGSCKKHGMVVYTGRDVTVNDVFARLVDSGRKIPNTDDVLVEIVEYLEQLKEFKIGDVLTVESDSTSKCGFLLRKLDVKRTRKKKLP